MTRLAESSEQRYRALVESSRGLICTHDMAGVLLSVNRAAADRLGYAADELVGRSLGDVLAPSVRAQFPQYLERLAHASGDEGLMLVVTRDGEERIWSYSNVRCQEPGGPQVPPEAAGYVERAIRAGEQIRDTVRNMSRITRLELSRQSPQLPPVLDLRKSSDPQG